MLLVEDNPEVASATMGLLEELGYNVRWVSDATSALSELNDDIDVLVSDIIMPGGMDGVDLAKTVRSLRPKLPILLMTGYSSATMEGTDFPILRKPYHLHELSNELQKITSC